MKINTDKIRESRAYQKAKAITEQTLKDPEKLSGLIERATQKAQSNLSGRYLEFKDSLLTCFRLLKAYAKGQYREIPWKSLSLIVTSVIYFLTPIDFIPDFLLTLGFIDDAALLAWTLSSIKSDLDNFFQWELSQKPPNDDQS